MRRIPRFLLLATVAGSGTLVPSVAGAEIPPGACDEVFAADPDVRVVLLTDPPARSEAGPGDTVTTTVAWEPANWDSLTSMLVCVRIVDTFQPEMSVGEDLPANDGEGAHSFVVPEGLPRGTFICTQARLSGDPAGAATEMSMVSKKSCLEVHPDAPEPPPSTSPAPSPAPPPAAAPSPPPPAPAPAPRPSPPADTAATPPSPAPVPGPVSAPGGAPATTAPATTPGSQAAPRLPAPAPPGEPVHLGELPRTGVPLGWLAVAGFGALAFGVPAVAAGQRHLRRRRG